MKIPLVMLALGAAVAGFVPFSRLVTYNGRPEETHGIGVFAIAPVTLALVGVFIAGYLYRKEVTGRRGLPRRLGGFTIRVS
jgi:NADH-quinone oxidoreductase subunit L